MSPARWRPVPWLRPLGFCYGLGARLRNACYDRGWIAVRRLPVPVVSVGNLAAGGTGKTPLVLWIVEELRARGLRPGVLARGYGRGPGEALNDEGRMLASVLPDLPQVQDPDRLWGGRRLLEEHGVDVVVLDDGFQHRRIHRDLDLVCLDAFSPFAGGACLPAGWLREPPSGLGRAHALVLTRADALAPGAAEPILALLRRFAPAASVHRSVHAPLDVLEIPAGPHGPATPPAGLPPEALKGRRLFLLSAIARPETFQAAVQGLGGEVAGHAAFPDHHRFRAGELAEVRRRAEGLSASILTTEKDRARLAGWEAPHLVLRVRLAFLGNPPPLAAVLKPKQPAEHP